MSNNKEVFPIAIVGSKPLYVYPKSGLAESKGWLVYVDFPGICVPNMRIRGGVVRESCTNAASEIYSGAYPFVTRVEYFFKNAPLQNGFKNMCRFETKLRKRSAEMKKRIAKEKKRAIFPISVSDKPVDQKGKFWKVSVHYDGNWELYFPKLKDRFEYNPFGAKINKCIYNGTENITLVEYWFRQGVFKDGAVRAWDFIEKVRMQIGMAKQIEKIK